MMKKKNLMIILMIAATVSIVVSSLQFFAGNTWAAVPRPGEAAQLQKTDTGMLKEPYVFPDHGKRLLTKEDLAGLTKEELKMGLAEIYAKYGQKFEDKGIQYFLQDRNWYRITSGKTGPDDQLLTDTEKANAQFIKKAITEAPDGNRERIWKIVEKCNEDQKRYYLRVSAGSQSQVIEHEDCFEVTDASLVTAVDPIPAKEVEGKQPGDMVTVCGYEQEISRTGDDFVELKWPNQQADYYKLYADWLIKEDYGYVPMMANDAYVSKNVYLGSIYFAKNCKMYGVEILGEAPKEKSVRKYLLTPWVPETWLEFEYGCGSTWGFLYGFIECDSNGLIAEYRELYTP